MLCSSLVSRPSGFSVFLVFSRLFLVFGLCASGPVQPALYVQLKGVLERDCGISTRTNGWRRSHLRSAQGSLRGLHLSQNRPLCLCQPPAWQLQCCNFPMTKMKPAENAASHFFDLVEHKEDINIAELAHAYKTAMDKIDLQMLPRHFREA